MTSKTQGKDEVSGMEAAFEKWFEARHCVVVVGQSSLRLTCKEAFMAGFNLAEHKETATKAIFRVSCKKAVYAPNNNLTVSGEQGRPK